MHRRADRYATDRTTLSSVFPTCYRFSSPDGVQTSIVCSMSESVLTPESLHANATALQPRFEIDLVTLAARVHVAKDWEGGKVLRDDFGKQELEATAREQNLSCRPHCAGDD